jgi:hypothetical protein
MNALRATRVRTILLKVSQKGFDRPKRSFPACPCGSSPLEHQVIPAKAGISDRENGTLVSFLDIKRLMLSSQQSIGDSRLRGNDQLFERELLFVKRRSIFFSASQITSDFTPDIFPQAKS